MKVNISSKWILISIASDSQYLQMLDSFISKSFKKILKLSDTIIIFHNEDELRKKKQLLFWISNIYGKVNKNVFPSFLQSITRAEKLHLKVKISNPVQKNLTPTLTLTMRKYANEDLVVIKSSLTLNKTISQFLRLFFKDFKIKNIDGYDIGVYSDTPESIKKIKELIIRKQILQFKVNCKYDFYVKSFFTNNTNNSNSTPVKLNFELQKSFILLGASKNEDFKVVKSKYLKLAKKYHPDSVFDKSSEVVNFHTKKFQEIQEAFTQVKLYFKAT